jgi:uncharacterized protein (DUF924 family)
MAAMGPQCSIGFGPASKPAAPGERMRPEDLISFWIGPLEPDGCASAEHSARWWSKDPEFDAQIASRFGETVRALARGERESWRSEARSLLAYVIGLDQFTRNKYRDTPAAFASDPLALAAAQAGLQTGFDHALAVQERVFLYMPFMHSEDLVDQDRCVALFRQLADAADGRMRDVLEYNHRFAVAHRNIVAVYGRFPHRNGILGRVSTADELAFLQRPGSSF